MKKRISYLGTLVVLITGLVLGGVVSARPQEGFKLSKDAPVEKKYPAMGPGCPACSSRTGAANTLPTAGQCGGSYVWCDAIPVEIVPPPGLNDDRDIFFTIIELHWDAGANNDLDLKFYDNGQSTGTTENLGSSESTKNPETLRVANADLGEYNIVVINYSGANTGYTIKARISTDPFSNPNESLAPDPPKKKEAEEKKEPEFVAPEDNSGAPTGTPEAPEAPMLDPVQTTGGDSDFDFDFSDLNDRITINADDLGGELAGGAPTTTKKEPVSPAVLLASLIGAPALIAGSGAAYVWRRRQTLAV